MNEEFNSMAEDETPEAAEEIPVPEDTSTSEAEAETPPSPEATASEPDAAAAAEDETRVATDEDESPPEQAEQPSDAAPAAEPSERLHPKERRRRARAEKAAARSARPPMTAEERQAERSAERRRKREIRRAARLRAREKARATAGETRETPPREHAPGKQKTRQGVVVSNGAAKTITVRIDTARRHRRYEKIVRTSRTLHAHDERGEAGVGDTVIVRESRPVSRTKRWRLVEIVEKAQ
jgi:small subunit ribosomal protein S17